MYINHYRGKLLNGQHNLKKYNIHTLISFNIKNTLSDKETLFIFASFITAYRTIFLSVYAVSSARYIIVKIIISE